jgi:hypothetical protein
MMRSYKLDLLRTNYVKACTNRTRKRGHTARCCKRCFLLSSHDLNSRFTLFVYILSRTLHFMSFCSSPLLAFSSNPCTSYLKSSTNTTLSVGNASILIINIVPNTIHRPNNNLPRPQPLNNHHPPQHSLAPRIPPPRRPKPALRPQERRRRLESPPPLEHHLPPHRPSRRVRQRRHHPPRQRRFHPHPPRRRQPLRQAPRNRPKVRRCTQQNPIPGAGFSLRRPNPLPANPKRQSPHRIRHPLR